MTTQFLAPIPVCRNCGTVGIVSVAEEGWTRCLRCDFYEGPEFTSKFDQALLA